MVCVSFAEKGGDIAGKSEVALLESNVAHEEFGQEVDIAWLLGLPICAFVKCAR